MPDPITRIKIVNSVAGCDIFHFGGHGDFSVSNLDSVGEIINKGQLILGNEGDEIFESDAMT